MLLNIRLSGNPQLKKYKKNFTNLIAPFYGYDSIDLSLQSQLIEAV